MSCGTNVDGKQHVVQVSASLPCCMLDSNTPMHNDWLVMLKLTSSCTINGLTPYYDSPGQAHLIQADVNLHRAALVPKAPGFWKPQVQ